MRTHTHSLARSFVHFTLRPSTTFSYTVRLGSCHANAPQAYNPLADRLHKLERVKHVTFLYGKHRYVSSASALPLYPFSTLALFLHLFVPLFSSYLTACSWVSSKPARELAEKMPHINVSIHTLPGAGHHLYARTHTYIYLFSHLFCGLTVCRGCGPLPPAPGRHKAPHIRSRSACFFALPCASRTVNVERDSYHYMSFVVSFVNLVCTDGNLHRSFHQST